MTWLISKIVGNPTVLLALLAAAFVAGVTSGSSAVWWVQGIRISHRDASIKQLQVDHATYVQEVETAAAKAKSEALERERTWMKEKDDAQDKAQQREATLKTQLAAARRASDGLRDDLAAIRAGIAEGSESTCRATADTIIAVLSECQTRYGEVGAAADGHASDVQTLIDAWPK